MRYKNLVSLLTALCFFVLAVSGVLSFFLDYSRKLATIHTVFGYFFMACVGLHLTNNWPSFKSYTHKKS
ncbi:protein of unknown function [Reichenbachiella faecimaris]|uniref:Flavinylation-associated cytochrome domain-containing protein n=1 Tax=Reichenbachiella faecimaris TaxID=692418 RepID=A0A1W2GEF0_REIFA|nr:protein of unknown function [Reichenbachiella faecimaris]